MSEEDRSKFTDCKDCAILANYKLLTYSIVILAIGKELFELIYKLLLK